MSEPNDEWSELIIHFKHDVDSFSPDKPEPQRFMELVSVYQGQSSFLPANPMPPVPARSVGGGPPTLVCPRCKTPLTLTLKETSAGTGA